MTLDPRLREAEVTRDGVDVDLQHARDLGLGEAAKVVQLDDPGLALVLSGEGDQGLVERHELVGPVACDERLVEGHRAGTVAALGGVSLARVIDEKLSHRARGDREEVESILELAILALREPQVGLRHQLARLQRVVPSLAAQVVGRDPLQLAVDDRDQLVERGGVTAAPVAQQLRHRTGRGGHALAENRALPSESSQESLTARTGGHSIAGSVDSLQLAQVEELFAQAAEMPTAERDAFLAAAAVDDQVRAEVRSLLAAGNGGSKLRGIVTEAIAMAAPTPSRLAERFAVRGTLGVGGMGIVLEAFDEVRREVVALKTLDRMDPQAIYDLKREFRTLADVVHPRLVRLHELFRDGERWFFSMQRLEGVPFTQHVRRDAQLATAPTQPAVPSSDRSPTWRAGRLDESALRSTLRDLVDGVRAIHRAGKLHRDLKPANVLVCSGRAVILDFGLVRASGGAGRSSEVLGAGTPAYMAPEQIDAGGAVTASDWYAVGAMIYEALTGTWPHTGTMREVLAAKISGARPADPRTIDPSAPADLAELAMSLLAADPAARPSEAEIVAVVGEPVDAMVADRIEDEEVFVGRETELATLRAAYDSRPALVRIAGASGIGKTALVDHFLAGLGAEPLVLRGRCYERESVPFKALDEVVDALSRYLARIGVIAAAKLMPRHAAELCRVFPVLGRLPSFAGEGLPRELDSIELRRRAFDALHEIVARIADRQPVVIAIDDVQWGDADSRGALSQLLDAPEPARALWLIGHRTGEEQSVFVRGLDTLRPAGVEVRTIELAALEIEQARRLVRAHAVEGIEDAAVEAIAHEAGGSPLFIGELVRGRLRTTADRGSLAELIRARVAMQPTEARRLLQLVALAGRSVPIAAVLPAAAVGDSALAILRAASLVRVLGGEGPALVDTYHDRIREAVVEALEPAERVRDHLALAEAFEAQRGSSITAELLALHYRGAERTSKAYAYTVEAARAASSAFAFDRAAELYRIAIELADHGARRELEKALGDALAGCGRGEEAADAYMRAAAGASDDEVVDLEASAASQLLVTGHQARGHELGRRMIARIGVRAPASVLSGFLLALLYWVWHYVRGFPLHAKHTNPDTPEALRRFDLLWALYEGLLLNEAILAFYFGMLAVSHGRRLSDPGRRVKALGVLANLLPGLRGVLDGRTKTWSARQRELGRSSELPHPMATYSMDQGLRCVVTGDWSQARDEFARAEELFSVAGASITSRMNTQNGVAGSLYYLGELGAYGDLSKRLAGEARRLNNRAMIGTHAAGATVGHLLGDDLEAARRELRDSAPASGAAFHLPGHYHCFAQTMFGLYSGEVEAARAYVIARDPDYRRARLLSIHFVRCEWLWYRTLLALGASECARTPTEAKSLRREATRFARKLGASRLSTFVALATVARAALATHEGGDARPLLEDACRRLDEASVAAFAAAARWQLGHLVGGDTGAAMIQAAEEFFRSQRVVQPQRIARMLAPGFKR